MNTICSIVSICGLWRVVAQAPSGCLLAVSRPVREEAVQAALQAEPEPA